MLTSNYNDVNVQTEYNHIKVINNVLLLFEKIEVKVCDSIHNFGTEIKSFL